MLSYIVHPSHNQASGKCRQASSDVGVITLKALQRQLYEMSKGGIRTQDLTNVNDHFRSSYKKCEVYYLVPAWFEITTRPRRG